MGFALDQDPLELLSQRSEPAPVFDNVTVCGALVEWLEAIIDNLVLLS